MGREKRKKNLPQAGKRSGSKNIKPDLWKRVGYAPQRKLASVERRERFEWRLRGRIAEGPNSGRSSGSDARLKKLLSYQ